LSQQSISIIGTPARLHGDASLPDLLRSHPIIVPTAENPVRAGFDTLCAGLKVEPLLAAEVDDMAMMRLLAREDIGLAILPPIVVKNELSSGMLQEARHDIGLTESFHAVTVKRQFPNPLLLSLMETARAKP
jgi:LysR family transcriptional activator of nhaA